MSFNVLPFACRPTAEGATVVAPSAGDPLVGAGEVIELSSWREPATSVPEIPEHVLDDVEAAAALWEELDAEGREVRFDTDTATGRIVASLCQAQSGVVRTLPLRAVVFVDGDGPQSAA